jgi:hypothetical protein
MWKPREYWVANCDESCRTASWVHIQLPNEEDRLVVRRRRVKMVLNQIPKSYAWAFVISVDDYRRERKVESPQEAKELVCEEELWAGYFSQREVFSPERYTGRSWLET